MPDWWDDATWLAMRSADNCAMCADSSLDENEFSILVASLPTSHVRLVRNQTHPAYCVVILREHATDLQDLEPHVLVGFWADVARAARAVDAVVHPVKIDFLVMGHRMPHVHAHLFPHYASDDPLRNVDISEIGPQPSETSTRATLAALRAVLA